MILIQLNRMLLLICIVWLLVSHGILESSEHSVVDINRFCRQPDLQKMISGEASKVVRFANGRYISFIFMRRNTENEDTFVLGLAEKCFHTIY